MIASHHQIEEGNTMAWKIELLAVPVTYVDRAKAFDVDQVRRS